MEFLRQHSLTLDALLSRALIPLHVIFVAHRAQVDGRELQVLYPLLEFLHHHRLNAADSHALAEAFAPLLMRLECDSALKDQEYLAQAYSLLTDILIRRYRTLFSGKAILFYIQMCCLVKAPGRCQQSLIRAPIMAGPLQAPTIQWDGSAHAESAIRAGIVTAPRTELTPEVASLPAQQKPASQRGAFGGRDAVARLFGRGEAPAPPPISRALSRSDSVSSDSEIPLSPSASAGTAQPAAHEQADSADEARRLHEVVSDVDNLLAESLDSMLFGEDDSILHEVSGLGIA